MAMPGWMAGRLLDGCMTQADGFPPEFMPPRWLRELTDQGYDPAVDGDPSFVVTRLDRGDLAAFGTAREALRDALDRIRGSAHGDASMLAVLVRTTTGRTTTIVSGRQVEGFASGALEAEPIRLITGPADL
jgi:hypothetical protein